MPRTCTGPAPATRALVIAFLVLFGSVTATLGWEAYDSQFVYAVEVDGTFLGYAASREEWNQAVQEALTRAEEETGLAVALQSEVSLTRTRPRPDHEVLTGAALVEACREALTFVSEAWAVTVDGSEVVFLRSEAEARRVIEELVTDHRDSLLAKGNTVVERITVLEEVSCRRTTAAADKVVDVGRAKDILRRGTDRLEVHVVARGESLWTIASDNSLTVADLQKANPHITDPDRIRVGERINLIVPDPYVNLESVELHTFIRYVPFSVQQRTDPELWPWESHVQRAGVYGREEVTVRIRRLNGEEVSRSVVSEKRLSDPVPQVFVLGTKQWPKRKDGWVFPVVGPITSWYGWRYTGFHHGLDIGAPYGTPVLATANGTVTFAGWRGGYGRTVVIDHGGGVESLYAHLSTLGVSVGERVSQGQEIGRVGNTGRSTGPHLHLEIRVNGKSVNPINYYLGGG